VLEYVCEKEIPQTQNCFCSKIFIKLASVSFDHMKCHIQIDVKLQNCVLFGIDKQVALLGFDPYRSGTTLNNQKRRKPLKLIDWTGTITPISLLLGFSSSNSVEQASMTSCS
jgi:hypothetical protein